MTELLHLAAWVLLHSSWLMLAGAAVIEARVTRKKEGK